MAGSPILAAKGVPTMSHTRRIFASTLVLTISIAFLTWTVACGNQEAPTTAPTPDIQAIVTVLVTPVSPAPPPTNPPVPTPGIRATTKADTLQLQSGVQATIATVPTKTPIPTLTPAPTETPIPPPTQFPRPTSIPEVPLIDLWNINQDRVFKIADLEHKHTWKDEKNVLLQGCRLQVSTTKLTGSNEALFSLDGNFSKTHYIVKISGKPSNKYGFQKGRCYQMVVTYITSHRECLFISYFPRPPFAPCPENARYQMIPLFMLSIKYSTNQNGKMEKYDNVRNSYR